MKTVLTTGYTFTPGAAGIGTLSFAGVAGFDVRRLLAVINLDRSDAIIYAPTPGSGYSSVAGSVITLGVSTVGHQAADRLLVLYEDPAALAVSGPLTDAQLRAAAVSVAVAGNVPVTGPVTDAQLRAAAVPVVEFPGAAVVANIASGATGAALTVGSGPLPNGANAWAIGINTPSSQAQTISFFIEQTDGTNWIICPAVWLTPTRIGVGGLLTSLEYHQSNFLTMLRAHSEGRPVQIRFTTTPAPVAITVTFTPIFIPTPTVQPVRAAAGFSFPVQVTGGTGGLVTPYSRISTEDINATVVVGGIRNLTSLWAHNGSAATKYLKIYAQTAVPVPGTHTPTLRYPIPPGWAGFLFNAPIVHQLLGVAFTITGGQADNDATAVGAGDVTFNMHYST